MGRLAGEQSLALWYKKHFVISEYRECQEACPQGHLARGGDRTVSRGFQEEEVLSLYMKGSRARHGWKFMGREVAQAMKVACAKVWSSQKA